MKNYYNSLGQCPGMVLPGSGKAFYLPLQQPPGPGYLRTYRNFQTPVSASIMADMTKKRLVHREYLAIVKGDLTPPTGTITAPLSRKERLHH